MVKFRAAGISDLVLNDLARTSYAMLRSRTVKLRDDTTRIWLVVPYHHSIVSVGLRSDLFQVFNRFSRILGAIFKSEVRFGLAFKNVSPNLGAILTRREARGGRRHFCL